MAFTNIIEIAIAVSVSIGVILIYITRCTDRRNCYLILIDNGYLDKVSGKSLSSSF